MPEPKLSLATPVRKLPKGVATHRSVVIRDRVIWCWKPLSSAARIRVNLATRAVTFNAEHLDRVLEARTLDSRAKRRVK